MTITIHSKEDFKKMRIAGKLAAETLDFITDYVKPGVSTNSLNDLCHDFIISNNALLIFTSTFIILHVVFSTCSCKFLLYLNDLLHTLH